MSSSASAFSEPKESIETTKLSQERTATAGRTEEVRSFSELQLEMARKFNYPLLSELRKITRPELEEMYQDACSALAHFKKTKQIRPGAALKLYNLGRCYSHGIGVKIKTDNEKNAKFYYECASQWGYIPAYYNLATLLYTSEPKKAVELLKAAAEYRYTLAYKNLGLCYLINHGVEPCFENLKEAYYYFRLVYKTNKLSVPKSVKICLNLFKKYRMPVPAEEPLPLSYEEELRKRELVSADDPEFLYTPDPDLKGMLPERFSFLQKFAASHKEIPSTREDCLKLARILFDLARCHFHRLHGAKKDINLALTYCRKAALELDFIPALTLLGEYHRKMALALKNRNPSVGANSATILNPSAAKAAKSKTSPAAAAATAATNPETPEKDLDMAPRSHEQLAYEYYLLAANRGFAKAQYELALLYKDDKFMAVLGRTSDNAKQDNAEFAFTWLMRAAALGFKEAKKLITEMHQQKFHGIPDALTNKNISDLLPPSRVPRPLDAAARASNVSAAGVASPTSRTAGIAKPAYANASTSTSPSTTVAAAAATAPKRPAPKTTTAAGATVVVAARTATPAATPTHLVDEHSGRPIKRRKTNH